MERKLSITKIINSILYSLEHRILKRSSARALKNKHFFKSHIAPHYWIISLSDYLWFQEKHTPLFDDLYVRTLTIEEKQVREVT